MPGNLHGITHVLHPYVFCIHNIQVGGTEEILSLPTDVTQLK